MLKPLYLFHLHRDRSGQWRWRCRHRNGRIVATCHEGYRSRSACSRSLARWLQAIHTGQWNSIVDGRPAARRGKLLDKPKRCS